MKKLLILLALLSGSVSAMTFEEYKSMSKEELCNNQPTYLDVRSWIDNTRMPEENRDQFSSELLHGISKSCVLRLQLQVNELQYELKFGKKPGDKNEQRVSD